MTKFSLPVKNWVLLSDEVTYTFCSY